MTDTNFRNEARQALERARAQLATGKVEDLRYAALELRIAMEALTYDRAQAFASEIPPSDYDTWQPKKLLQVLLEIDPHADQDNILSVGIEEEYGERPATMKPLGPERVLNLAVLRRHYDALASHLHMPTIRQFSSGKGPNSAKLLKHCNEVADLVASVLASAVFNVTLGSFAKMPCAECGQAIRKRIPPGAKSLEARCFKCPASYCLEANDSGQVVWKPQQQEVPCQLPGCGTPVVIWKHEMRPGRYWICPKCSSKNLLRLGACLEPQPMQ